jgi:toxin ParE1/3/4
MKIEISDDADLDLENIYVYGFINFGQTQAERYSIQIRQTLEILRINPFIGRMDTRIRPPIRRFETQNHVIFYDAFDDRVSIARVLHKSVDFINEL